MMEQTPWGYSVGLDIAECDASTIRSAALIQDYVIKLCKLIDMKRHGDIIIEHFGTGNKEGFTMVQLIETSCITAHFANETNCAYIDVFSCKEFDTKTLIEFTLDFFGGKKVTAHYSQRGAKND